MHAAGRLVETHGPFERGRTGTPEARLEVELPEEGGLTWVGLSRSKLNSRLPRLVLDSPADLTLEPATGGCGDSVAGDRQQIRLSQLEPELRSIAGEELTPGASETLLNGMTLSLLRDTSRACRAGTSPRLVRFMSELQTPPAGSVIDGEVRDLSVADDAWTYYAARALAWLDEERLLLATSAYLMILRRGASFESTPSNTHRIVPPRPELPGVGDWYVRDAAVDPRTQGIDRVRVLVTYQLDVGDGAPPVRGALWRYELEDGALVASTLLAETERELESIAINDKGRFVAGGSDGTIHFGTVEEGILETISLGQNRSERVEAVQENRSLLGGAFYILTEFAAVSVLELDGPLVVGLRSLDVPETSSSPRGFALRPVAELSPEVWVGTYSHGVQRRHLSGVWERVPLHAEPQMAPCAVATAVCGRYPIEEFMTAMAPLPDGRVLLGPGSCSAALLLDPETGCLDGVPTEGEPVLRPGARTRHHHVAVSPGGQVAFLGNDRTLVLYQE